MVDTFAFPEPPGSIHYVTRRVTEGGRSSISLTYTISGPGQLVPTEGTTPAMVRLIIQRRGDDLTLTNGPSYRFWSQGYVLTSGVFTLAAALDPTQWTNVSGQNDAAGFAAALADLENVGFTFGGMFAGHGVYVVNGSSQFRVEAFTLQ